MFLLLPLVIRRTIEKKSQPPKRLPEYRFNEGYPRTAQVDADEICVLDCAGYMDENTLHLLLMETPAQHFMYSADV